MADLGVPLLITPARAWQEKGYRDYQAGLTSVEEARDRAQAAHQEGGLAARAAWWKGWRAARRADNEHRSEDG
jgi:hypothetical protein